MNNADRDFVKDMTPDQALERLTEFAMFGLDERAHEVEQLVKHLQTHLDLLTLTTENSNYWMNEYFRVAEDEMNEPDPGEENED